MNLLAHRIDGTEAIIQHHDNRLPYFYRFGEVDTYELITDHSKTVDPATWKTEFPISGNEFNTIDEVKQYLHGFTGGAE